MTATAPAASPASPQRDASLKGRARIREKLVEFALRAVAVTSIAAIILILAFVAREALPCSREAHRERQTALVLAPTPLPDGSEQFLWQPVSQPAAIQHLVPLLVGSLKVTLVSLLIAAPLGIAAAV